MYLLQKKITLVEGKGSQGLNLLSIINHFYSEEMHLYLHALLTHLSLASFCWDIGKHKDPDQMS